MATPARIGYINRVQAIASSTSEQTGFEADSLLNPLSYERWKPVGGSGEVILDLGGTVSGLNYVGIGAHTMGGGSITVSYSPTGGSYAVVQSVSPSDNTAIMITAEIPPASFIKIAVSGANPSIGVVYVGNYLQMYRPFYSGHTPITLSRRTTHRTAKSEGGQWLGRTIARQGLVTSYQWKHTPIQWYIDNIEPLSIHLQTNPIFMQWSPEQFPDQVAYGWTTDDLSPTLMGIRDLCEFGFDLEAIE